jgi:hypothetical protein
VVRTAGGVDLGTYRVRPPSAREAISLMEVSGDFDLASEVIRGWLPARLSSLLLSRTFTETGAMEVALSLLSVGLPDRESEKAAKKKAQARSWDSVCAEYLHIYPSASLDDPWPLFVERCLRIDELRARDELSQFIAHAVATTGKGIKDVQRRAGFDPDFWDEEAALATQKASLESIAAIHQQFVKSPKIGRA